MGDVTIRELRHNGGAMIAAIATANQLPLYTANPDDFAGIDDLTIVAVSSGLG